MHPLFFTSKVGRGHLLNYSASLNHIHEVDNHNDCCGFLKECQLVAYVLHCFYLYTICEIWGGEHMGHLQFKPGVLI